MPGAFDHVLEFPQGDLPGAGTEAAVGVYLDALRAEHARGVEYAVAHELGRLDKVRVDVYDAEPDLAVPPAPGEPLEHFVAGTVLGIRAELPGVAVGELELQLVAVLQRLDVREEPVVVGEADVHAGAGIYALACCVEGLDDKRHFLRAGRCGGLVDLDPLRPRLDEPCDVRTHHVARHVHPEAPPSFGPLCGTTEHGVFGVVLVVGPVHDGVGSGERNLDGAIRVRPDELELLEVIGLLHERLLDDGGLSVVLVVEGADRAAGLKTLRVPDRVIVHLAATLLAVVDHVEACALQDPDAIEGREVLYLHLLLIGEALALDQYPGERLNVLDAETLAPSVGVFDVFFLDRTTGYRLNAPARLCEATYLSGGETDLSHLTLLLQYSSRLAEAHDLLSGYLLRHELQVPVGHEVQLAVEFLQELPAELRDLFGLLEQGVPRVHDAREQRLRERARQRFEVRRVEVYPNGFHVELHELAQDVARVPEWELQRDRQRALQGVERVAQWIDVDTTAEQRRFLQHDHRAAVPREPPDLGSQHALGDCPRLEFPSGGQRQRVRRGKRRHPASGGQIFDPEVRRSERLDQPRGRPGDDRGAVEGVGVQKAREWPGLQTPGSLVERPEDVLPVQQAV